MQIITTIAEHHSNFVPWQQLAKEMDAKLTVVPLVSSSTRIARGESEIKDPVQKNKILRQAQDDNHHPEVHGSLIRSGRPDGDLPVEDDRQEQPWELDLEFLEKALKERPTALVAVADVSNVLGTVNPTAKIVELAHTHGVPVLVDAAQSLAHLPINVRRLGADFLVGSGHKAYGPTGIGFLWAKREHLETMAPVQFGGEMIRSVSVTESTWNDVPWKFEAGTPNIAGAIGFAAALEWLSGRLPVRGHTGSEPGNHTPGVKENWQSYRLNWEAITNHEEALLTYATQQLRAIPGLTILGPTNPRDRAGVIAFTLAQPGGFKGVQPSGLSHQWIHPHDLVSLLDEQSVELRAGRHCAQPLHDYLGLPASTRMSVGVYSNSVDIDRLSDGIRHAQRTLLH